MLWKVLSKKILQMKSKINNRLMKYLTSDIVNLSKPLYTKSYSNRGHYTLVLKEKNAPSTPTNESSRIPSATYYRGLTSGDK